MDFELVSNYKPQGDQPQAIEKLIEGIKSGKKSQVLLGATGTGKTFTVPKNCYFVLGDNRADSNDSRYYGFVPKDKIVGIAKAPFWNSKHKLINDYYPATN